MDYHRFGGIGVGSLPAPLLNGPQAGLTDHLGLPISAPPSISGIHSSLLTPHHPSLMFHYGLSTKPPNIPTHLLPRISVTSSTLPNSLSSANCHPPLISSINSSPVISSKSPASAIGVSSTLPIGINSNLATNNQHAVTSSRSSSPNSFAAALRSLAKQATGPPGLEFESHLSESSGSQSSSTKVPQGGIVPSIPPHSSVTPNPSAVSTLISNSVSMAPSPLSHLPLHDIRKPPSEGINEIEALANVSDPFRGFQPYRPPELPPPGSAGGSTAAAAVSQPPSLRPSLPLDMSHAYPPYSSLFSHHLNQYRLEEQLYLERYGLLRPSLPSPYGVGGLPMVYPNASVGVSPYLPASRFHPDLLPTSLATLHSSSALLHERLKLEEDMRQREYELEIRREREMEREREKERGRDREKRNKENHHGSDRIKDDLKRCEVKRERSPQNSHSSTRSTLTEKSSLDSKCFPSSPHLNPKSGIGSHPDSASSTACSSTESTSSATCQSQTYNVTTRELSASTIAVQMDEPSGKNRHPVFVRPFENHDDSASDFSVESSCKVKSSDSDQRAITSSSDSPAVSASNKPFSVWQPVDLGISLSSNRETDVKTFPVRRTQAAFPFSGEVDKTEIVSTEKTSHTSTSGDTTSLITTDVLTTSVTKVSSSFAPICTTAPISYSHAPPAFFPYSISDFTHDNKPAQSMPFLQTLGEKVVTSQLETSISSSSKLGGVPNFSVIGLTNPLNCSSQIISSASNTYGKVLSSSAMPIGKSETNLACLLPEVSKSITSLSDINPSPCVVVSSEPLLSTSSDSVSLSPSVFTQSDSQPTASKHFTNGSADIKEDIIDTDILQDEDNSMNSSPEKVAVPVSRLDAEEQRLRELRASGVIGAEAGEALLEEALAIPSKGLTGSLCTKGPPTPFEASSEKLDFLCSFGLTTHDEADRVELDRYERRAKILIPLASSTPPRDDSSSWDACSSSAALAKLLAPGCEFEGCKRSSNPSLMLGEFEKKCRFLEGLRLEPVHSSSTQKEVERVWKLIIEDRFRRYGKIKDQDEISQSICRYLGKLLENFETGAEHNEQPQSSLDLGALTGGESSLDSSRFPPPTLVGASVGEPSLPGGCGVKRSVDGTIVSPVWTFPVSGTVTTMSSLDKVHPTLLKCPNKADGDSGGLSLSKLFFPESDPVLAGLPNLDRMVEHVVRNAKVKVNSGSSLLLQHIEEVRRNQFLVCQTAKALQDQVTTLISLRSQLESYRTALHHHLTAITSMLSTSNPVEPSAPCRNPMSVTENGNIKLISRDNNGTDSVVSSSVCNGKDFSCSETSETNIMKLQIPSRLTSSSSLRGLPASDDASKLHAPVTPMSVSIPLSSLLPLNLKDMKAVTTSASPSYAVNLPPLLAVLNSSSSNSPHCSVSLNYSEAKGGTLSLPPRDFSELNKVAVSSYAKPTSCSTVPKSNGKSVSRPVSGGFGTDETVLRPERHSKINGTALGFGRPHNKPHLTSVSISNTPHIPALNKDEVAICSDITTLSKIKREVKTDSMPSEVISRLRDSTSNSSLSLFTHSHLGSHKETSSVLNSQANRSAKVTSSSSSKSPAVKFTPYAMKSPTSKNKSWLPN